MSDPGAALPLVSVVCPVYNEASGLEHFHATLCASLATIEGMQHEIVYVDDGSADQSVDVLRSLPARAPTVRIVELSRNFGKEAALSAGIHHASGDVVVTCDTDGEHPVERIPEFVALVASGKTDVVAGVRSVQPDASILKRLTAWLFYFTLARLGSDTHMERNGTDFRAFSRPVANTFGSLTERGRVVRSLIDWAGFETTEVEFSASNRIAGRPSYGFKQLAKLALNAITGNSTRPLYVALAVGSVLMFASVVVGLVTLIEDVVLGDPLEWQVSGSAYVILAVLFAVSLVVLMQGITALYLARIYEESLDRPLYVVRSISG